MNEVFAILTVCGVLNGEPDCIELQERGPPFPEYHCMTELLKLKIDFAMMQLKFPQYQNYEIVDQKCVKEALPYGHKPREESL